MHDDGWPWETQLDVDADMPELQFKFSGLERWLTVDEIDGVIGRDQVTPEVRARTRESDSRGLGIPGQ